jgi:hypothetical protein
MCLNNKCGTPSSKVARSVFSDSNQIERMECDYTRGLD